LLKVRVSVFSILLYFIHDPRWFLLPLRQQKERQRRKTGEAAAGGDALLKYLKVDRLRRCQVLPERP
jgi:hypothetical protein